MDCEYDPDDGERDYRSRGGQTAIDELYCDRALRLSEHHGFLDLNVTQRAFVLRMARRWNGPVSAKQRQWLDGLGEKLGFCALAFDREFA